MAESIRVSVAMATYNGEKYIKEQIESILKNLQNNDELVISDDGSNDSTLNIINSFGDKRIKLIKGPGKGIKQNFNNAIKNTKGEYIFLSDQDDIWMPDKVETVVNKFNHSDYLLIQHDAIVIDENQEIIYESFAKHRKVKTGILKNIIKNSYHGCCIAFRNELKEKILPIPENINMHDQWIGLIAELNGKTFFEDEVLIKYRRHNANNSSLNHSPFKIMIKNRLNCLLAILNWRKR